MKSVASFSNLADAGFAMSVLEGAGIPAELENVESSINLAGGPPAIRVVVAESDFDRASELIRPIAIRPTPPQKAKVIVARQLGFSVFLRWSFIAGLALGIVVDLVGLMAIRSEYFAGVTRLILLPCLLCAIGCVVGLLLWAVYDSGFAAGRRSAEEPNKAPEPTP